MTNIPATAEEVLTILEALAQMDHNAPVQHLPQYVLVHAFRSLKLSTLEQREVMGMVTAEFVSIDEVKRFVSDRMLFYSLWSRTFHKTGRADAGRRRTGRGAPGQEPQVSAEQEEEARERRRGGL